jgi:hypothetical protein
MELFTAGNKSQMATIERWIDESDVFMLILGGRYGSIEPTTGLSYVELEYDYAVAHDKPTFAVVITEAAIEARVKSAGTAVTEKENQKLLAQFREKVLKNISSFFSDPKDIKLCAYESMSDYAADPNLKGWIAAEEVPETGLLQEELKRFKEENDGLTGKVRELEAAAKSPSHHNTLGQDQELLDVLKAIEIKVPAKLTGKETDIRSNLLSIALSQRDRLTNGVTNHYDMSDADQFLYFNILPKLQNHGLAENEKVPGVRYRRSYLNKQGQMLLAELDRRRLLAKAKEQTATRTSPTEVETTPSKPPKKAGEGTLARAAKLKPPRKKS